jgi:hypothetical protein
MPVDKRTDFPEFIGDSKRQSGHLGGHRRRVFLPAPQDLAIFDPSGQCVLIRRAEQLHEPGEQLALGNQAGLDGN